MNNIEWRKYAPIGFLIAFLLALIMRTVNSAALPLSLFEAQWAMPALAVARGGVPAVGSQPAYTAFTSLFFFTLGDGNLTARLAGILVGASLVWLPYFYRRQIGLTAALIMAFGLALDPLLTAFSRLAGGSMLAVGFGLWALTSWIQAAGVASAILAGLALLSGPAFLQGVLSLAGAWLVVRVLPGNRSPIVEAGPKERKVDWQLFAVTLGITLLLAGTMFTLLPEGLGALANSIPDYLQSWWNASGVPALRIVLALLIYQPLALVFVVLRCVRLRTNMDALDRFLLAWLLVALLLIVLRVGRQPYDLVWAVVPMWGLAGRELQFQLQRRPDSRIVAAVEAALILILLFVSWMNLAAIIQSGDVRRWLLLPLLLLVAVVATVLIGLGWSRRDVRQGLVWGVLLGLGIFTVGEALAVVRPRSGQVFELWQIQSAPGMVQNFERTMGDLSEWVTGRRDSLEVQAVEQDASLRWSLRNFPNASFPDSSLPSGLPGAVISDQQAEEPQLAGEYRGQSFEWEMVPNFNSIVPPDWVRWLVFRQAPLTTREITLWARADIFPGGLLFSEPAEGEQPTIEDEQDLLVPELPQ